MSMWGWIHDNETGNYWDTTPLLPEGVPMFPINYFVCYYFILSEECDSYASFLFQIQNASYQEENNRSSTGF